MTVTRADVLGRRPIDPETGRMRSTAHLHLARFYIQAERQHARVSWTARIAAAPSPFAVEGLLADFVLFGSRYASEKARAQVFETARVRTCELRGVLP